MEEEDVGRCEGGKVDGLLWNLSNMSDDASILLTGMISSAPLNISVASLSLLASPSSLVWQTFSSSLYGWGY